MKKYFCALIVYVVSAHAYCALTETKEFEAAQMKKIEIKNPKGEVEISGVKAAKKTVVTIEKIKFDSKCKFQTELSAGVLKLAVVHDSGLFDKSDCEARLKIEAPASLSEIEASTGTGTLKISGMDGTVDFKTATGNVEIKGENLKGVSGKTATGHIIISYQNCPKRADIDFMSASGDADVRLGSSCKIRASHKSAAGELFNELGDSEDYQVLVTMKSASGNLKIKKAAK